VNDYGDMAIAQKHENQRGISGGTPRKDSRKFFGLELAQKLLPNIQQFSLRQMAS
jgi:hypothetical protein